MGTTTSPGYQVEIPSVTTFVATTVQLPPVHVEGQLEGAPHCPLLPHVWTCVLDAHWVVPGEQALHVLPMQA